MLDRQREPLERNMWEENKEGPGVLLERLPAGQVDGGSLSCQTLDFTTTGSVDSAQGENDQASVVFGGNCPGSVLLQFSSLQIINHHGI